LKLTTESEQKNDLLHPKLVKLHDIIIDEFENYPDSHILIFAEFRDTITLINNLLKKIPTVYPVRFVGQKTKSDKDKGMSQKNQIKILEEFREGKYNVLVSTSVAEEGLDIAECDVVIFYDAVPSEIRLIQRKGRTARQRRGKVLILYCKDSSDEKNLKSSLSRLQEMQKNIKITASQPPKSEIVAVKEESSKNETLDVFMNSEPSGKIVSLLPTSNPRYELQEILEQQSILWEEKSHGLDPYHYFIPVLIYKKNFILILLTPAKIQQGKVLYDEFWTEMKQISTKYSNVVIGIDFVEYVELVEGEKDGFTREIKDMAKDFSNVLVIPIDSVSILHYLIIPIVKKQVN